MGLRVDREKLMLALHCRRLGQGALAGQIYAEQQAKGWPGLAGEVGQISEKLGIESCDVTFLGKVQYRKYVSEACHAKNAERLREAAEGKQKCERITREDYVKKDYVSSSKIEDVRKMYRTRYGLSDFAGNYSHARKFEKTNFMCRCERTREDERHITSSECPVYADIREQFSDLQDDNQLVKFFAMVLARRDKIDSDKEKE